MVVPFFSVFGGSNRPCLSGLARISTLEQVAGLQTQIRDPEAYGCERIFKEQVSSVAEREQLGAAFNTLREGDKLISTKLDRLARSVQHLSQIIERINSVGASLVVLDMDGTAVDTSNPTGKLTLNVMSSVAQFERGMPLERQHDGIAKAKAEGKYKGRKQGSYMSSFRYRQDKSIQDYHWLQACVISDRGSTIEVFDLIAFMRMLQLRPPPR